MSSHDQMILQISKENFGIDFVGAKALLKPEWKTIGMAMDAEPGLITTPNAGIPAFLTTFVDPNLLRILQAPREAAEIIGEEKRGSFADATLVVPVVENTGTVSAYGDDSNDGVSSVNTEFEQRQSFNFQTIVSYGELEIERMALAKIDWAGESRRSAIETLLNFQNLSYFKGITGLQNYGLLNDPSLSSSITPATKAATGVTWWNGTVANATANEVYADITSIFMTLVTQSGGGINNKTPMVLAMSPKSHTALTFTNQYNVNVIDLLAKNFPNMEIKIAMQYGATSTYNNQGNSGGELVQLIAKEVRGQKTGFAAFNEKLRSGPVIPQLSGYKQKMSQGTWGAIIRQPFAIASMIGV